MMWCLLFTCCKNRLCTCKLFARDKKTFTGGGKAKGNNGQNRCGTGNCRCAQNCFRRVGMMVCRHEKSVERIFCLTTRVSTPYTI